MLLDKNSFLSEFREEVRDYLRRLNENTLALEQDPGALDHLQKMKKITHNLKGAARIIEFKDIEEIAHNLEYVLEALENKKLVVTHPLASALFLCFDLLEVLTEHSVKGTPATFVPHDISNALKQIASEEISPEIFLQKFFAAAAPARPDPASFSENKNNGVVNEVEELFKVKAAKMNELLGIVSNITIDKIKIEASLKECRSLLDSVRNYHKIMKYHTREERNGAVNNDSLLKGIGDIEKQIYTYYKEYETTVNNLGLIIDKLQERSLRLRMLPLSTIFTFFPRLVRDIALSYNKKIDVEIKGAETELDRKMLGVIKEPLVHLLRNAIDHGIESEEQRRGKGKSPVGKVTLKAWQEGEYVLIAVEDDGRGIHPQKIREIALQKNIATPEEVEQMSPRELIYLVFRPGFTTSSTVTKISGRGVGLDIVREQIEQLKGEVILESLPEKGTTVVLRLPLTLSISSILLVETAGAFFGIPIANIEQILLVAPQDIQISEGKRVTSLGRRIVPLVDLSDIVSEGKEENNRENIKIPVIVVVYGRQRKGFIVDTIASEQEVVVKSLGKYLGKIKYIAGAAILGNGDVAFILNIPDLMSAVNVKSYINAPSLEHVASLQGKKKTEKQKVILLVEDSLTTREMEKNILETVGYKVLIAMDGLEAIDRLVSNPVDLIISDIEMPRMDGIQLTHNIKQDTKYKHIPIIIVTAVESVEDKRRGIEAGADAYIRKSEFDQTNLLQTIETLIG